MNELQKRALKELEDLEISYAETGRDREMCFPSIEEEDAMRFLEAVIDGCEESMQIYAMSKLHDKCKDCCRLDIDCIGTEDKNKNIECQVLGPISC